MEHWADGGETKLDNLILLCRRHHRAVHEGNYRIGFARGRKPVFFDPRGFPLKEKPRPTDLPMDPVQALAEANRAVGARPEPWGPSARWKRESDTPDAALLAFHDALDPSE